MPINSMNIVLTGENFPVSSLKVEDFTFRHRPLRETLRLPVALRAEASDGRAIMQVLPDRFEVSVTQVERADVQAEGLVELVRVFQEYAGRRTIIAVGHNVTTALSSTQDLRPEILAGLVRVDELSAYLGSTAPISGDVMVKFRRGRETAARLQIRGAEADDVYLDLNFHYDLQEQGLSPLEAARLLPESLAHASQLFDSFLRTIIGHGVEA